MDKHVSLSRRVLSDNDLDVNSQNQVLERVKSDRISVNTCMSKDEEKRRRTIIIEKQPDKNGSSFGFTLQSYGIHYKKDQEIEMISYVDSVEYNSSAYKGGLRPGDVILAINNTDMEKADHKTLVNFIKNCDNRMRMVVLFEDCVRKVELHVQYINLQELLRNKMEELERVCLRERELLEGKWKTHSLPARKKATGPSPVTATITTEMNGSMPYCRPLSTEDIGNLQKQSKAQIIPPPAQYILNYQYLDPSKRYVLRPSATNSSGEYLNETPENSSFNLTRASSLDNNSENSRNGGKNVPAAVHSRQKRDSYHHIEQEQENNLSSANEQQQQQYQQQQQQQQNGHSKSSRRHCHGHSCNPCMSGLLSRREKRSTSVNTDDKDRDSVETYDLPGNKGQSPNQNQETTCCDARCVPQIRHKHKHHKHKHRNRHREDKERSSSNQRPRSRGDLPQPTVHYHSGGGADKNPHKTVCSNNMGGAPNNCSFYSSCTSSNFGEPSSYSTSLSSDTLYNYDNSMQQIVAKSPQTLHHHQRYHHQHHQVQPMPPQPVPMACMHKPKSWDNLAAKASGGYGFGYGYMDTTSVMIPNNKTFVTIHHRHSIPRKTVNTYHAAANYGSIIPPPTQFIQETTTTMTTITTNHLQQSTKSTENLLGAAYNMSDSSCECIGPAVMGAPVVNRSYYSNLSRNPSNASCSSGRGSVQPTGTEVTKL